MASDLGATAVPVEFVRGGTLGENWVALGVTDPTRSIWCVSFHYGMRSACAPPLCGRSPLMTSFALV